MLRVGFVGWRGMVGSVLMQRMVEEGDFDDINAVFYTTSQTGQPGPEGISSSPLIDAKDLISLAENDVIISCQGGDYTKEIQPQLREAGWTGYWIDAASTLRMEAGSTIVLDPVNGDVIQRAIDAGQKDFVGGNCTVSVTLMAINALIERGWVEWVSSMTYQAASGGGARHMRELLMQMGQLRDAVSTGLDNPASNILDIERTVTQKLTSSELETNQFGNALAGNLLPWIDSDLGNGQSREEWKAEAELNKILDLKGDSCIPIDGICVRIGALRCHSKAMTIKLTSDIPLTEIEDALKGAHQWMRYVENDKESTLERLTPATITGSMEIGVGRLRKLSLGDEYLSLFAVGDQLLWGAAEPLRRMLRIFVSQ